MIEYAFINDYVASLNVLKEDVLGDDSFPVFMNWDDNKSAVRLTNHACKKSEAGRALGSLFCAMLINSPLGVNAKWLSTDLNVIADEISQVKQDSHDSSFDYSCLQSKYPQLTSFRLFQPSAELLYLIWDVMFTKSCPYLCMIRKLKQS